MQQQFTNKQKQQSQSNNSLLTTFQTQREDSPADLNEQDHQAFLKNSTLAALYANRGQYRPAIDIYVSLLELDPANE
jgi:hypothetical protein